mgnify:CR=1 FL=1
MTVSLMVLGKRVKEEEEEVFIFNQHQQVVAFDSSTHKLALFLMKRLN